VKRFILPLAVMCMAVTAAEIELNPIMDTYVYAVHPDSVLGNHPNFSIISDGPTPDAMPLIQFEFPPDMMGKTVQEATLYLYVLDNLNFAQGELEVLQAADPWDEGTVTWNSRPGEERTFASHALLPSHTGEWFQADVTLIVQHWLLGVFPNYGFYIGASDQGKLVTAGFASREHADADLHPRLHVRYEDADVAEQEKGPELKLHLAADLRIEISYSLPSRSNVTLRIYDASGALVETPFDAVVESGTHHLVWNPPCPGVYFVRLETPNRAFTQKAVLIR